MRNFFYFQVEQYSTFGEKDEFLNFIPIHYSINKSKQANLKYRIDNLPAEYEDFRKKLEASIPRLEEYQEPQRTNIRSMEKNQSDFSHIERAVVFMVKEKTQKTKEEKPRFNTVQNISWMVERA